MMISSVSTKFSWMYFNTVRFFFFLYVDSAYLLWLLKMIFWLKSTSLTLLFPIVLRFRFLFVVFDMLIL